jgi:acetylornithine deacetylase/succinyl-diaminopimelate desuccinylase family protein
MGADPQAIRSFLSAHWQDEVDFLAEMVKVPTDNPPGDCRAHADRAAALLEKLGFTVERHAVPDATVSAHGMVSATNLIVRHRFGPGPTVALNAHGDVVPPGGGWTTDPYGGEIKDGWMYGRGVAVSKSDFATYAYALLALKAAGARPGGAVELHFTYDEEIGGEIGPKWILDRGLSKPDYAICAGFSYGIVTAHNGCLHLEVTVTGKSAHAAFPATGHDALEAATAILKTLYRTRKEFTAIRSTVPGIDHPSLIVGLIAGGINTNVVPDKVTFRLDRRMIPEEDPAKVESDTTVQILRAAAGREGISCQVRRILLAAPFRPAPGQERLVGAIQRHASDVLGEEPKAHGVPLYTDARHYGAAGIPTVLYGAGPRTPLEANAHRADERLPLDDLRKATEIVALAVADLLEGR